MLNSLSNATATKNVSGSGLAPKLPLLEQCFVTLIFVNVVKIIHELRISTETQGRKDYQ